MFRVRIRNHERGVWLRHGEFKRIASPGVYWLFSRLWSRKRNVIEVFSILETRFVHPLLEVIAADADAQRALLFVDLNDAQRALVWKDGRLAYILGPGRHAFWRTRAELRVESFDVNDLYFAHARLETVLAAPEAAKWLDAATVEQHQIGLLFRNGQLLAQLEPGKHVLWKGAGSLVRKSVERREVQTDVAGQEIMTSDKVTLRVNLLVTHRVIEPVKAVTAVGDYTQALYREAQLALRAAIGTRTLDALLADKEAVGGEVRAVLSARAAEFGVEVRGVGLRDIILPGDMREILNQVIAAEKQAQANLIKRREETAAARNQANTARLLAETPLAARMKELELLGETLKGAKVAFVFGDGDVARQVRGLIGQESQA